MGLEKIYYSKVLNSVIDIGHLPLMNTILDFGCGTKELSKRLRGVSVYNFDRNPRFNEMTDYMELEYDIIVVNHVLEHMDFHEIYKTLKNFIKISSRLIVGLPTENIISKIGMILLNKTHEHDDHKTDYKTVLHFIRRYYNLVKEKNVWTLTNITYWVRK